MRPNPRIIGAAAFGLLMVVGAFFLSRGEATQNTGGSMTSAQPVRTFIKVDDEDQNGIPDWQESLNIPTINLDEVSTSTEMTKTAELAVSLVGRTLINSPTDPAATFAELGTNIARGTLDRQYTRNDIKITDDNSPASLKAYGNKVAEIAFGYAPPPGTENELTVLNRAYARNDPSVLTGLDPHIAAYEAMLEGMLETQVPSSLVKEHLSLINVYEAVLNDTLAFRNAFSDALPVLTRLRRYPADTEALYLAILNVYLELDQKGIEWTESDSAFQLVADE